MKRQTKQKSGTVGEKNQTKSSSGSYYCPKCGGEMISAGQGVRAEYPAPALERLVCSVSDCNYARYVKLDESGFADERGTVGKKGA